jgi:hypothetical protein
LPLTVAELVVTVSAVLDDVEGCVLVLVELVDVGGLLAWAVPQPASNAAAPIAKLHRIHPLESVI